jgi:3-phenylpropionate/trans-cinnamate dioxygenase ferredoxin reductase subunit
MAEHPASVVIVGAGQAGASLAARLRAEGYDGPVTLIGEEPDPPYQRPPLSKKYLLGELSAERLLLKPRSFYEEQGIKLRTGARVAGIDRDAREVLLGEERLPYGALALTTGAVPRRLPAAMGGDLGGVHVIRTRADVDRMAPELAEARRVLIVGGGYIGLEAAAVSATQGRETVLLEAAERILGRVASAETAAFLRALHAERGVDIREGTALERLEGADGRVSAARLATGERLEADLAIVGIGIAPDTALADAAGLAIENGIRADARCRTSDPAILAAGDCASFPFRGGRIRLESVQNAIDQGEHAARAILGSEAPYAPQPWFWSDQYDARLQIAGLNLGYTRVVERAGSRPGGRSFWYFRDGEFLAVDAISDPKAYMQGKRWLAEGRAPDPARLGDASVPLAELA